MVGNQLEVCIENSENHRRNDTLSKISDVSVVPAVAVAVLVAISAPVLADSSARLDGKSESGGETADVAAANEASTVGPAAYDEKNVSAFIS